MPEEAVDVVYNGELDSRKWWILHIEPSGAVNMWKFSDDVNQYQRILTTSLELGWLTLPRAIRYYLDDIIASLDIEGLYKATPPAHVGGVGSLPEIRYKVVQVSG